VLEVPPRPWSMNTDSPSPSISTAMRSMNIAPPGGRVAALG
jgi:hypothetical protein